MDFRKQFMKPDILAGAQTLADHMKNMSDPIVGASELIPKISNLPPIDTRTRAEIREDFESRLSAIDKESLTDLKNKISEIVNPDDDGLREVWSCKKDIENSLILFIRYIDRIDELNSEEFRKVALKEKELKLEARHDWAEKGRTFLFRILASVLFIVTLFTIGYIEKNYEWAVLPLSKFVSTSVPVK